MKILVASLLSIAVSTSVAQTKKVGKSTRSLSPSKASAAATKTSTSLNSASMGSSSISRPVRNSTSKISGQSAIARSQSRFAAPEKETAKDDSNVKFSMGLGISRSAQMQNQENGSREEGMSYQLAPSLKVGKIATTVLVGYSQDLKDSKNNDIDDAEIKASLYSTEVFEIWKLGMGAKSAVGLSKASREVREFNYSLGPTISLSLNSAKVGAENTMFILASSVSRNFHKATTDAVNGDPLTQYSWVKGFVLGYKFPLAIPVTLGLTFMHVSNFSYENVVREGFVHEECIAINITESFEFKVAHFNKAPMYKAPTYEYNLKFADKSSSFYYASLGYNF